MFATQPILYIIISTQPLTPFTLQSVGGTALSELSLESEETESVVESVQSTTSSLQVKPIPVPVLPPLPPLPPLSSLPGFSPSVGQSLSCLKFPLPRVLKRRLTS